MDKFESNRKRARERERERKMERLRDRDFPGAARLWWVFWGAELMDNHSIVFALYLIDVAAIRCEIALKNM